MVSDYDDEGCGLDQLKKVKIPLTNHHTTRDIYQADISLPKRDRQPYIFLHQLTNYKPATQKGKRNKHL